MFSFLKQGSLLYVLDKTEGAKLKIGEVVSVSAPHTNYQAPFPNQTYIDVKVTIDGNIHEYNQIPSQNSIVTYNNGKITISETKQELQSEVETLLQNSRQIISNIGVYQKNIDDCEDILKELSPQYAKDKERDDRIESLEDKLDKILKLLDK